jgi:SAM-dependent methyltransferase
MTPSATYPPPSPPPHPRRIEQRQGFIRALKAEQRHSVVEIGCGNGADGLGFVAAGLHYSGVDLSPEHVHHCTAKGLNATVGSGRDLPYADVTFDAGWSMDALVHVANHEFDTVLTETLRVLTPAAPLAIGLEGGHDAEEATAARPGFEEKFFSFRSEATLRRMLREHGTIESFLSWQDAGRRPYLFVLLRTPG